MLKRFDWSTGKLNLKILITDFEILKFLPSPGRPSFSRRSLSFEICCLIVVFETLGLVGFWFWGWFSDQGISLAISASTWSIRNIISYNQIITVGSQQKNAKTSCNLDGRKIVLP